VSVYAGKMDEKYPILEMIETEKMDLFYLSPSKEIRIKTGLVLSSFHLFFKRRFRIILFMTSM